MTKTGIAIYSGQIDISKKTIEQSDKEHALFAGFISAILSISEETQESES